MARRISETAEQRLAARAKACVAAFGADPARWPAEDQSLYVRFENDPAFAAALRSAARLDDALDSYAAPEISEAAKARLLARAPTGSTPSLRERASAERLIKVLRRRLIPASALAATCAIGFAVGALDAQRAGAADEEALVYAEAAIDAAFQEEDALWATGDQ
ncbi:hypothetical protein [Amphiplicatus metriothermophilus]|uniref:Uncharacterized protein n=1 Tax=Amphiplicatus metriothermophilus TaxID=1519374 RepID=A0A239PUW8_9PROT|nr:hypothetical protein [Amphiplicatus metriothermophilus]MBB5519363.1 hypothetical protein [Amphiplicatus metriothermophilus]SNT73477.1 hypothetical protein SAMN06297382_1833 [Amphiplicatus metriothermophilus]